MLFTGLRTRPPGTAKSGQTRSSGARTVSRTRLRSASVRRKRRGRSCGEGMAGGVSALVARFKGEESIRGREGERSLGRRGQLLTDLPHDEAARELGIEEGALLR